MAKKSLTQNINIGIFLETRKLQLKAFWFKSNGSYKERFGGVARLVQSSENKDQQSINKKERER